MSASPQNSGPNIPSIEELGFDPQELRRKYDYEREKRLRPDANKQYQDVVGDLARFHEDPYIEETLIRDALDED
ncbi:MAG: monooxygenase, partial [Proteobacteria bacterium]|nr:monooxygenase [Pseudomonadota bacterium]